MKPDRCKADYAYRLWWHHVEGRLLNEGYYFGDLEAEPDIAVVEEGDDHVWSEE